MKLFWLFLYDPEIWKIHVTLHQVKMNCLDCRTDVTDSNLILKEGDEQERALPELLLYRPFITYLHQQDLWEIQHGKKCEWVVPRTVIIEFSLDFIEVSLEVSIFKLFFLHPKTQDKNYIIQYPATENNSKQQIDYMLSNSETIGWKKKERISCWWTKYILLVESAASCKYSLYLAEFRWMD